MAQSQSQDFTVQISQFMDLIKSKNEILRSKGCFELKRYLETELNEQPEEVTNKFINDVSQDVLQLANSSELSAKKGAVMAIDVLLSVDVGSKSKKNTRSKNSLEPLLNKETDPVLLGMAASVMGRLVLSAGQMGGEIVDAQVKKSIEELSSERTERNESRKLVSVLVLRELAQRTPTFIHQFMQQYFDSVYRAVRDSKAQIRLAAISALRAGLAIVARRDTQQNSWYEKCLSMCVEYNPDTVAQERIKPSKDDWSHGTLLLILELLKASNLELERQWEDLLIVSDEVSGPSGKPSSTISPRKGLVSNLASKMRLSMSSPSSSETYRYTPAGGSGMGNLDIYQVGEMRRDPLFESLACKQLVLKNITKIYQLVFPHQYSRNTMLSSCLIEILPRLAALDCEDFSERHLRSTITYVTGGMKRDRNSTAIYLSLGFVCKAVTPAALRQRLPELMGVINTFLPRDLPQRKPKSQAIDSGVFTCISLLARAMGPEMSFKIKEMIDPMFHCPLSPALTTAFTDISQELPSLKRDIQDGLLSMLSLILTGKAVGPASSSKVNLNNSFLDSSGTAHEIPNIILALRTLGTFDFEGHSLGKLLRHCADNFLTSDNKDVRLEAVKTCSSLLTQAAQASQNGAAPQNQTVADVLGKLLSVAITDREPEVRQCVLDCLENKFDDHLAQAENLASLFIALGDERFEIRTKAIMMIGHLSGKNPAYVMPSLRKILIQLMVVLEHSGLTREKEQAAVMLGLLVYKAPRIITPYLDAVVDVLSSKLSETGEQNSKLITNVLHALGEVSEVGGRLMLPYSDRLMPRIVEMLEDPSNSKRQEAIRTLGSLVFSTGLVIEPYQRHPKLMTVLHNLLASENDILVRKDILRLLGLLGALDPYLHRLTLGQVGGREAAGAVVSQAERPSRVGDSDSSQGSADASTNEMLVNTMTSTSNLEDFYPAVAIASMMKIVNDQNLSQFHLDAVTSINFVFTSLGVRSVQYIPQVVPACLRVMRENEAVREFLFKQLSTVIKIVKLHIKDYMKDIFDIIQQSWASCQEGTSTTGSENRITLQITIISLLKDMVQSIGSEFKVYLPTIIPHMLKVFVLEKTCDRVIMALLDALQVFEMSLDRYIHLLLPLIMRLLDERDLDNNVKRCALETITKLSNSLDLNDFASNIIHPIVRALEFQPELHSASLDTLTAIVTQLGRRAQIFKPMICRVISRNRVSSEDYSKFANICVIIEEGSSIQPMIPNRPLPSSTQKTSTSDEPDFHKRRQKQPPTNITKACLAGSASMASWTKDDWLEWLRRFDLELLKNSPNQSLRACFYCAQNYPEVARELFNAAFVSCWYEFTNEKDYPKINYKMEMTDALEQILKSTNVPEITQTILNLAEFMEHCDSKGALLLAPTTLGEQAVKCRAYAKALHYIEQELHPLISPQLNAVSSTPQTVPSRMKREQEMVLLEKLITINNHLQQSEASRGVLLYVQGRTDDRQARVPGHFFEKLHQWDDARKVYQDDLLREKVKRDESSLGDPLVSQRRDRRRRAMLGKMRCLESLGEWSALSDILNGEDVCSWNASKPEHKKDIAKMAAAAAWGLDNIESMKEYTEVIPKDSFDGLFYRAILCLMPKQPVLDTHQALEYIDKARELMCTELSSLATESYSRAYRAMVNVQMLVELEEVIQYNLITSSRQNIKDIWWKRMKGCHKLIGDWSRLLQVHSLCLADHEDPKSWLKFADLCRKNGRMTASRSILDKLVEKKREGQLQYIDNLNIEIAHLKHTWQEQLSKQDSGRREAELSKLSNFISEHRGRLAQFTTAKGKSLLAKCYLRLGSWTEITSGYTKSSLSDILSHYKEAVRQDEKWSKAWHAFAYANFEAVLLYKSAPNNSAEPQSPSSPEAPPSALDAQRVNEFCVDAIEGFFKSISLSQSNSLQDTLRLLTLWFDYGEDAVVYETISKGLRTINIENWLQVIPQLIARIDTNRLAVRRLISTLLCDIGRAHPQALVYPLTVASKSTVPQRSEAANKILDSMRQHSPKLVDQALLVSHELIRVAILWHELWHDGLEEASRLYFGDKDINGMLETLEPLHRMLDEGAKTMKEQSFEHAYGTDLREAQDWCNKFRLTGQTKDITKAWDSYYHVFRRICKQLPLLTSLEVHYVSPKLLNARDLELAVPGTYDTGKELVSIRHLSSTLQVITSKQRPRKLSIQGSDGREYQFLLKGHEDLRQDERVMQLFGLVNSLLLANPDTCRRNLTIQRFTVIPLSTNSGLIGWVPHTDTLHSLIRDYRERKKILLNIEHRIMIRMAPDYDHLTLMQKVEVFEHALAHTVGDDLAKILWFKSPTSEVWLDRRTNYTRSLAVMSMVGYVLGLGDRHPSNLMLDRESGKIIHIDFGDCFEVAMSREKFPEKIPFRLTRMLTNAMEVTGIDGNYRMTCERVMDVLRDNKDSVMAVLEAFVYDPLLNWWTSDGKPRQKLAGPPNLEVAVPTDGSPFSDHSDNGDELGNGDGAPSGATGEVLNKKALDIVRRVKDKLTGRDFEGNSGAEISKQIDMLIKQATNHANLCQCYIGWCPFW